MRLLPQDTASALGPFEDGHGLIAQGLAALQEQAKVYALAAASVTLALSLGLLVGTNARVALGPLFFVAAIAVTSWRGGMRPGLAAVAAASLLVDYFWVAPLYTLRIDPAELPWFAAFVASGLLGMTACLNRKRVEEQLTKTRDELESRVAERTRALEASMSEHQRAEEDSRRAQEELARVMRLTTMGELAASIAHEINQPLAAVTANAQASLRWLAGEQPNIGEARTALQSIVRDARRAAEVVKTIRAMATKSSASFAPLDLNALVLDVLTLIDKELGRRHTKVQLVLDPDLPEALGDRVQCQQVLLNLVMNALDAMDAIDAMDRRLRILSSVDHEGWINLSVQDSGEGIAAVNAERIFDAFFTTRPHGMGMGLAICRSIAEGHGGRLWFAPAAERGTTVCLALPPSTSLGATTAVVNGVAA